MFDVRKPYDLSLDCFANEPLDERPLFSWRRLTCGEFMELESAIDIGTKRVKESADEVYSKVCIGLVGWKNQRSPKDNSEVPYNAEHASTLIKELVDPQEAFDLIVARLYRARVNGAERKNSESQS